MTISRLLKGMAIVTGLSLPLIVQAQTNPQSTTTNSAVAPRAAPATPSAADTNAAVASAGMPAAPAGTGAQVMGTDPPGGVDAVAPVVAAAMGPIPDTPANRAKYGAPLSRGGRASAPDGN